MGQGRQIAKQLVHFLRKSIAFGDGATGVVTVGTIPAGAVILQTMSGVSVSQVFNWGAGNVIHVGTSADNDLYGTSLSLATLGFTPNDEAVSQIVAAYTTIYATHASSTTPATTGTGEIIIAYIPDTDG